MMLLPSTLIAAGRRRSSAVAAIDAFSLTFDQATPEQISMYGATTRTVAAGATVGVQYRQSGSGTWIDAHPLSRIVPGDAEPGSPITLVDAFAGVIFDLSPGTTYDILLTMTESGQPTRTLTTSATTRSLPAAAGTPNKNLTTAGNVQTTFNGLVAGDVLELANGTYNVNGLTLSNSGSSGSPIYIRGASRSAIIRDTAGLVLAINASHIVLENLTIEGSSVDAGAPSTSEGIRHGNSATFTNLTIRDCDFVGVDKAIASDTGQIGTLVYNCNFQGNNPWSATTGSASWDDDCIRIPGKGCCAWNNTINGFGDACAMVSGEQNIACFFWRNRVTMTCDDSMEGDYSARNCGFYDNYITNAAVLLSLDPLYGGPFYCFRNVCINTQRGPFKWNSATTGAIVYNNTIVRTEGTAESPDWAWVQFNNGAIKNWSYRNNILVYRASTGNDLAFDPTTVSPLDFDHNAWYPDGRFKWQQGTNYASLSAALAGLASTTPVFSGITQRHTADVVTSSNPFTGTITLGADYTTQYSGTPDCSIKSGETPRNGGIAIPGITDGYSGAAPDMGAIIAGRAAVTYGATRP